MRIQQIKLKNFRGYYSSLIKFSDGINIFVGPNGSGKSNLLEAIHYLSYTRSFRGVEDRKLIKNNESKAVINAVMVENKTKTFIDILITENGKKILINNKGVKQLSFLNQITNVIVFAPNDVMIFRDSPKNRREYLDINISKLNQIYGKVIVNTKKIIKERNELLKQKEINQIQLDILTEQLIKEEKEIIIMRQQFVNDINSVISKITSSIKSEKNEVQIIYTPYIKIDDKYLEKAKKLYQQNLENDLKKKTTTIGIHHEDFILKLNNENIAIKGSQGENRLMAIALKIAPYFLVKDKNKHPIIALDDVMSELDNNYQEKLFNFLKKLDQVFITTTNIKIDNASIYEIYNHQIIRRK